MTKEMKLGLIGCDTSHCVAFARILNDPKNEHHIKGPAIAVAFPGGSPDFELSISRVDGYTKELRDDLNVRIVDSPEAVAEASDAILLTSVDGRVHLEQFRKIAPYKKPVYIDKPFALKGGDAKEIFDLAQQHGIPLMSCSALRYADGFQEVLRDADNGEVIGADLYGPMAIQPTQPGLFWYGIHTVEMLFASMGRGCSRVTVTSNDDHDFVVGLWSDGRIGTVRGNRKGNNKFGGIVHREKGSRFVDAYKGRPYYVGLMEAILSMFQSGKQPIDPEVTVEIVRFIEAANQSRESGQPVELSQ